MGCSQHLNGFWTDWEGKCPWKVKRKERGRDQWDNKPKVIDPEKGTGLRIWDETYFI